MGCCTSNHFSLLKDVRGCMTHFDPLTPEIVAAQTPDGLTYDELKDVLQECGMSIGKVLYDASRSFQNAFFADFEKGHYCWVPFQKSGLREVLSFTGKQFREKGVSAALRNHEWSAFYMMEVPLPMLIYDFERRYREIDPEQVFKVWSGIHTRIDYANGMWKPDVLEYVFSHAPQTDLPEPDADGYITIYRGMGELSQTPETAISWSTSPKCALWFANRGSRGTRMVTARVKPDQILVYNPGYRAEHEVIMKPGTNLEIQETDMIPSTEDHVPKLLVPVTRDFFRYGSAALTLGYPVEGRFQVHGIKHILRVLTLSLIYFYNAGDDLSEEEKQILVYFSLLHDIGRDSELKDGTHGEKSVELIRKRNIRLKGIKLSRLGYRMTNLIIANHCRDDEIGLEAISSEPGFTAKDIARTAKLYQIAKDMDGLDRVRFSGLDFRYLRTPYARRLPLVAGGLLEEPLLESIESYREGELEVPD